MRALAEVYDEDFVPALFGPWAARLCALADLRPGQRVLDVACGSGAVACVAAERVAPGGAVVGLDASAELLAIARRKRGDVEWRDGRAESLPFADASFDRVLSQFALMYFGDRAGALREMHRVLRPGGRMLVSVFDALERSPCELAFVALLQRLFGARVADAYREPFALGDANRLRELCTQAGIDGAQIVPHAASARFASIDAIVDAEQQFWPLPGLLDAAQFAQLRDEARTALAPFVDAGGALAYAVPALLIDAAER